MTTTHALSLWIGKVGELQVNDLMVKVKIIDSRQVWGRTDCLVAPVAGSGEQWVSTDRLAAIAKATPTPTHVTEADIDQYIHEEGFAVQRAERQPAMVGSKLFPTPSGKYIYASSGGASSEGEPGGLFDTEAAAEAQMRVDLRLWLEDIERNP
jgi:hypothetical protein